VASVDHVFAERGANMSANSILEEYLFTAALEKPTLQERQAYLDTVCRGNPDLRHDLELLLAAHEQLCRRASAVAVQPAGRDPASPKAACIENSRQRPGD
jgi:hypothetical protein